MAQTTFTQLPPATGLNGGELFAISQYNPTLAIWSTLTVTALQLQAFIEGGSLGTTVSMRQLKAALVNQGIDVTVSNGVPADVTNASNIAWSTAYIMPITDTFVTGFMQPLLGYTAAQITALFVLAQTFPV